MSHPYRWDDRVGPDWFGWAMFATIALIIVVAITCGYYSRKFEEARHCRPTSQMRPGWAESQEGAIWLPNQQRWWMCDQGGEWR